MIFRQRKNDAPASPPLRMHPPTGPSPDEPDRTAAPESSRSARDLVIGAISGYGFSDVQYWVNSLDRSGYSGEKVVIVYDAEFETVRELNRRGCAVVTFGRDDRRDRYVYPVKGFKHEDTSIDRFYQVWRFLRLRPDHYRFVVSVDVRDVVFQRNPSAWLEDHLGDKKLNVGSEGIRIADEPWNSEVVLQSYGGEVHAYMGRRATLNAGTIAGRADALRDLSLNVFLCCRRNRITYTDQAALNILLSLEPYRSITRFNGAEDDWACQAGAMEATRGAGREATLLAAPPVRDGSCVRTPSGEPYCIVHQYDRIPEWKERLQDFYSD